MQNLTYINELIDILNKENNLSDNYYKEFKNVTKNLNLLLHYICLANEIGNYHGAEKNLINLLENLKTNNVQGAKNQLKEFKEKIALLILNPLDKIIIRLGENNIEPDFLKLRNNLKEIIQNVQLNTNNFDYLYEYKYFWFQEIFHISENTVLYLKEILAKNIDLNFYENLDEKTRNIASFNRKGGSKVILYSKNLIEIKKAFKKIDEFYNEHYNIRPLGKNHPVNKFIYLIEQNKINNKIGDNDFFYLASYAEKINIINLSKANDNLISQNSGKPKSIATRTYESLRNIFKKEKEDFSSEISPKESQDNMNENTGNNNDNERENTPNKWIFLAKFIIYIIFTYIIHKILEKFSKNISINNNAKASINIISSGILAIFPAKKLSENFVKIYTDKDDNNLELKIDTEITK